MCIAGCTCDKSLVTADIFMSLMHNGTGNDDSARVTCIFRLKTQLALAALLLQDPVLLLLLCMLLLLIITHQLCLS